MRKNLFSKIFLIIFSFLIVIITINLYKKGTISLYKISKKVDPRFFYSEIPFRKKVFNDSFDSEDGLEILNIVNFEKDEMWQGSANFDYNDFIEGQTSVCLNSNDGVEAKSAIFLKENLNINNYAGVDLFFYSKTPFQDIGGISIVFLNSKSETISRISPEIQTKGWNYFKYKLDDLMIGNQVGEKNFEIKKIEFSMSSNNGKNSVGCFDLMTLFSKDNKVDKLISQNNNPLKFFNRDGDYSPLIVASLNNYVGIKEITSARNFTFQSKITPIRSGSFGLVTHADLSTGTGYYFIIDGIDKYTWEIFKQDNEYKLLASGEIRNFSIEKEKEYWMKVRSRGELKELFFSTDGEIFIKLGEIKDLSYISGGVGFGGFGTAVFSVDEISFVQ